MATNPKQSFLDTLLGKAGDAANYIINSGASSQNPSIAIPYKIAQNPGQFVQNAAEGAGNLIKSTVGIPMAAYNSVMNGTEGNDLKNLANGIGQQYKTIAQHPIDSFMNDPVGTSLAIAPAGGLLGKAGDAGKVAEAAKGAETATTAADTSSLPKPLNKTAPETGMITPAKAAPDAIANYNSIFQVPRNVVQNMKIKPDQIINTLINDGVTNVKSLDDLENVANSVTGENGAFPRINRIMLQDIKTPVNYATAKDAIPTAINHYLDGSPQGLVNTVKNQIERAFPTYDASSASVHGITGDEAYASHLFDASQELDSLQRMYDRKAHTQMGDLTNPEYERAAQAIGEVKNNLQDVLDKQISPEQYQQYKNDPRVRAELEKVPPAVAQRWLANAKQFRDGRAIQAPYVGLSKMIDHTKDAQLAAFTKWTKQMQQAQPSADVTKAIVHPVEAMQGVATRGLQKVISPLVDKTPEDMMAAQTSGQSASMKPGVVGSMVNPVANAVKAGKNTLGPIALGQEEISNNANSQNNNINGQESNNNTHIQPIAQYLRNSKLDETGHYTLPSAQEDIQPLTPGTPDYTRAEQALPGGARQFMANAPLYSRAVNGVIDDLKTMPLNLLLSFKKPQEMLDYASNPQNPYAQQVADLAGFNKVYAAAYSAVTGEKPSDQELINPGMSPSQLQQRFARMIDFIDNSYKQFYVPYAQTSAVPSAHQTGGNSVVNYQQAPAQDSTAGMVQPGLQQMIQSLPPIGSLAQ